MLEEVATFIHSFTNAKPFGWLKDHDALVEYGIAHFVDEGDEVKIEEPLALTALVHFFEDTNYNLLGNVHKKALTGQQRVSI